MQNPPLYLKRNVQVEPLIAQWYVWPHLIPPATAARNITERCFRIMDSYISAPALHAAAVKNPKMLGGPFINLRGNRVAEVKALRQKIAAERSDLVQLSTALGDLDVVLSTARDGMSLQPLYEKVPGILRGYVELVYDLRNVVSYRLIEPLLYQSSFYNQNSQSVMLSLTNGDDRPFVLSTPRLEDANSVHLRMAFSDAFLDKLFSMKKHPLPWQDISDTFSAADHYSGLAQTLFSDQPPSPYSPYDGPGVRWRYYGHACILIETAGVNILVDPVLSYSYKTNTSRYTYNDLPDRINCILITHNHTDHILFETLLQLRHKTELIVVPRNGGGKLQDPSTKWMLKSVGFRNVCEMGEYDEISVGGIRILGLPFLGEHCDLDVQSKLIYHVRTKKNSLLFAADFCNFEPKVYEHVRATLGSVDVLFIGMECDGAPLSWFYGPLMTQKLSRAADETRRLAGSDCNQALQLIERLNCKEAYVYAMGQEPWLNYVMSLKYTSESRPIAESDRFIRACLSRGVWAERLYGEKEILIY